jgi:MFS family permease
MNGNTQKGLYFLIIGSIIIMIYSVINSISSFFTLEITTLMIISFFGIVSFIGLILILIGAILFLMGRKEFGEKHQNNVKKAVIIFCINIIAVIALTVVIAFMTYSVLITTTSSSPITSPAENITGPFTIVIIIIAVVTTVLGGLIYYFGLIELENETGKKILFAGIISSITISLVTSLVIAGMLGELFGSISSDGYPSSLSLNQNVGGIGILGIIPNLLFLYAMYIPYNRIKNGELKPQVLSIGQSSVPSRICPNCGRPIPFDANNCPYCGKNFESY